MASDKERNAPVSLEFRNLMQKHAEISSSGDPSGAAERFDEGSGCL